jgi:transcriptional regulator with XRE-family HTH domain
MKRMPHREDLDDDLGNLLRNTAALRGLTEQGIDVAGSVGAIARRLGVARSHISRVRIGRVGMDVETCLILAEVIDEEPFLMLHKCGNSTMSDRLERLHEPDTKAPRARFHDTLERLRWRDRQIVSALIDRLSVNANSDMADADPPRKWGRR